MSQKSKALRELAPEERIARLGELRSELMHERGIASMGGQPASPGRMRSLRRQVARLQTIMRELGERHG